MKNILGFLSIVFILTTSCSEYQDALKSEDLGVKFDMAMKLYEESEYTKSIRLTEQIAPVYKGKPQAEKLFYVYSKSLYNTNQFYLASYQFESFAKSYPKSEKYEEALFLEAKSLSMLSPVYSLDQVDTYKAIEKFQTYIDLFPNSDNYKEANAIATELRLKLEKKAFENAKIYNSISQYKAAIVSLDNFLIDYPGTVYKEKALFYKLHSAYNLAINSVPLKKLERLNNAKTAYDNLMKFKSDTEFKDRAVNMLARIDKEIEQITK